LVARQAVQKNGCAGGTIGSAKSFSIELICSSGVAMPWMMRQILRTIGPNIHGEHR
jgi:hypothetical protein